MGKKVILTQRNRRDNWSLVINKSVGATGRNTELVMLMGEYGSYVWARRLWDNNAVRRVEQFYYGWVPVKRVL